MPSKRKVAPTADVLTRVARGSYSDIIRPLEADSSGVMVPHLMSLEDAKKIVYYSKFYPIGRRPVDGGNADAGYVCSNMEEYTKKANEERFIVVQIEDPEPLAELDSICALPGIDMIFFGPADFSQGIGKPFQFGDEEIIQIFISYSTKNKGIFLCELNDIIFEKEKQIKKTLSYRIGNFLLWPLKKIKGLNIE